nr:type I polyketide synthase [Pedobacter sp. ASV19]
MEYLGRIDDQVKIRGYRIELGEVEHVLQQAPGVKDAAVIAQIQSDDSKRLVGYVVVSSVFNRERIFDFLKSHLPDYMIPQILMEIKTIPLTGNGKLDKKALPEPNVSELVNTVYVAPKTNMEEKLVELWCQLLDIKRIGIHDNFFELGGNSLLAQKTVTQLRTMAIHLPVTKLYQYPTVSGIAAFIEGKESNTVFRKKNTSILGGANRDIAIIGMAGRFPGADTIETLWEILKSGKETIHFFAGEELSPAIPDHIKNAPDYVKARGIINGATDFDASFFGITPKLAELMDPQQRIFLEVCWEALERSGYTPARYEGAIGVYAGAASNTYFVNNVIPNPELIANAGNMQVLTLNDKDYLSSRVAYSMNLKGPAVTVQSACSTSLLAVAQAVDSIRNDQCDIALAGGVSINSPINSGHLYEEGAMLSKDGHCRPFDSNASGTMFSDGAAVVVLKSRAKAEKDGDFIYAVIKGVGLSNDGGGKGSFTAPSAQGQAASIYMAMQDSNISADEISYVEAHGTATPLGDPIEIEGLKMAFGDTARKQYCAIGSIKGNLGHLTHAAGVTGLIKTALALHHHLLPASINYKSPNPNLNLEDSPFKVNDSLSPWNSSNIKRAGVSSFGVGGTNVHVILEEAENQIREINEQRPVQIITWSAKNNTSLEKYPAKLLDYIKMDGSADLEDIAYNLGLYRQEFNKKAFIVCSDKAELSDLLANSLHMASDAEKVKRREAEVVFMFPGQGSQYVHMGRDLYKNEPVFRLAMESCASLISSEINEDILQVIYPSVVNPEAEHKLRNTKYSQPALFCLGYAIAKLWMSWGIHPAAFIGHSIGEFVAAHLAGVFSLEDAVKLITARGSLMADLPQGSMLSVRSSAEDIATLLPEGISIAAVNTPKSCVLAGPVKAIQEFSTTLSKNNIANRLLQTSHAFHSVMMDPVIKPFEALFSSITLQEPVIPIASTVTGTWMTSDDAMNPTYWSRHLRSPVLFSEAAKTLLDTGYSIFIESGAGSVTSTLIKQQSRNDLLAVSSIEQKELRYADYYTILKSLGTLWTNGIDPDWTAFYKSEQKSKLPALPTYAFDSKYHWIDKPLNQINTPSAPSEPNHHLSNTQKSAPDPMRKQKLIVRIKEILENTSGIEMTAISPETSFIEAGFDSLLLTQVALLLKKEFNENITFRQLNDDLGNVESLAVYLDSKLPTEHHNELPLSPLPTSNIPTPSNYNAGSNATAIDLISQQLQLLAQQLNLLQNNTSTPTPIKEPTPALSPVIKSLNHHELSPEEAAEIKKPFGATARIEKQSAELTGAQLAFLKKFEDRYTDRTKSSKAYTQKYRMNMADPRVVSGFKPSTKELVYPIVASKSKGSRIWDLDGNEYIDALNGFGSNMLGYQPDFIKKALIDQIENGYEIGPQHELAGEVCELITDFTGFKRVALCNTGSEAVLGAMRIARTVTGRSLIVAFTGSYHGIVDEVIVRGSKKQKSFPAAPGIMPEAVQNMLILDYGTDEALEIIKTRSHEIAAVLVEPVQSRRPEFQPIAFLKHIRAITKASGSVLIFDEIVSGFRFHPGGTQAMFGIRADIATYGKVVGAGISIGVIAGEPNLMDALDGGFWQYGDLSSPEAGVTYFAGTFVRHPLALASAKASLNYIKEQGPSLQLNLNNNADYLVRHLNQICVQFNTPMYVAHFCSVWKIKYYSEYSYSELLFTLMRDKGIHILDGFPCFLTTSHSIADIDQIILKFKESVLELKEAGFIPSYESKSEEISNISVNAGDLPPVQGAKLGKDQNGNPAWFIQDKSRPGKYLQVQSNHKA